IVLPSKKYTTIRDTLGIINNRPRITTRSIPISGCAIRVSTFATIKSSVFSAAIGLNWYKYSKIFSRSFSDSSSHTIIGSGAYELLLYALPLLLERHCVQQKQPDRNPVWQRPGSLVR